MVSHLLYSKGSESTYQSLRGQIMIGTEVKLFDEYKRVDNICRDMFSSQSGVSQYITEMERNSFRGRYMVSSWDRDYRRLKRIRWLRNQIAHESSATDCNEEDVTWLEEFHHRLLECQDPLALLGNASRGQLSRLPQHEHRLNIEAERKVVNGDQFHKGDNSSLKWVVALLIGMAVVAFLLILHQIMSV